MAKAGLVLEMSDHGGGGTGCCAPQWMTSCAFDFAPSADDVPGAPVFPERLLHQLRVAAAQFIAEHGLLCS